MPERSLPIAAYAAGASVAAATLVYIFGPTFVQDRENDAKRRSAVGLTNYANDCFINSVLQALAGLPTLQVYLVQELQLRHSDGIEKYAVPVRKAPSTTSTAVKDKADWQIVSLQRGVITVALKAILDELNERPTSKKVTSAQGFVMAIEQAFRTRVSRHQQDAQEFLQIVLQRVAEEYHAAVAVREHSQSRQSDRSADISAQLANTALNDQAVEDNSEKDSPAIETISSDHQAPIGLPFEGKISSQIECTECGFRPKPSISTFVTLSLVVPQETTSTSLDSCLDGMLKVETIDGYKCDRCRLTYIHKHNLKKLQSRLSTSERQKIEADQVLIEHAIEHDPEKPSPDLKLKDTNTPAQRIKKHMSLSKHPRILTIHLSRSLWTGYSSSAKNLAKVSFPEVLHLGSLVDRHKYQLRSVVTHKGGHNSGHYETFRRQTMSTSPSISSAATESSQSMTDDSKRSKEHGSTEKEKRSSDSRRGRHSIDGVDEQPKKKKAQDRWSRISDDKIKECKTSDVLAMQKEVYLLFYELLDH